MRPPHAQMNFHSQEMDFQGFYLLFLFVNQLNLVVTILSQAEFVASLLIYY